MGTCVDVGTCVDGLLALGIGVITKKTLNISAHLRYLQNWGIPYDSYVPHNCFRCEKSGMLYAAMSCCRAAGPICNVTLPEGLQF